MSATKSPQRRSLPLPNCQSHRFTLYTVLPFLPAALDESVMPCGTSGPLVLTVLVGDSRCRVPFQKQGEELDSPQHVLAGSYKEDGRGGRLTKFSTPACSIGQSLGKSNDSKVLKNTSSSLMSSPTHQGHRCSWPNLVACRSWVAHCT